MNLTHIGYIYACTVISVLVVRFVAITFERTPHKVLNYKIFSHYYLGCLCMPRGQVLPGQIGALYALWCLYEVRLALAFVDRIEIVK